jgi:hypothetical protein
MATPMVSGGLALIKAVNPGFNAQETINILTSATDDISRLNVSYWGMLGKGRINLEKAVDLAKDYAQNKKIGTIFSSQGQGSGKVSVADSKGNVYFDFYPYGNLYRKGINVAVGDLNGDGQAEIITGAGPGGGPHIRIFDSHGKVIGQFFAYDKNFRGGVNVAVGDLNGDGQAEIITGAGPGGGPHIRIFDAENREISGFFAFSSEYRSGIKADFFGY